MSHDDDAVWVTRGATLSDKSARTEYGLTQDEILAAIHRGQLRNRVSHIFESVYFKLIRSEVEALAKRKLAEESLSALREQQTSLTQEQAKLLESLGKGETPKRPGSSASSNLYALDVFLTNAPFAGKFRGKIFSRTIEILGFHTLYDLHKTIFDAFNRVEQHFWEFQIGGKGPYDPKSTTYAPPELDDKAAKNARTTTLDSLKLKEGQPFGYIFDFGGYWEHQINVMKIEQTKKKLEEPRVVKRIGKSPPQHRDAK